MRKEEGGWKRGERKGSEGWMGERRKNEGKRGKKINEGKKERTEGGREREILKD